MIGHGTSIGFVGFIRVGQPHGAVAGCDLLMVGADSVDACTFAEFLEVSPIVGKSLEINPSSVQASLLRKKRPEQSVI